MNSSNVPLSGSMLQSNLAMFSLPVDFFNPSANSWGIKSDPHFSEDANGKFESVENNSLGF